MQPMLPIRARLGSTFRFTVWVGAAGQIELGEIGSEKVRVKVYPTVDVEVFWQGARCPGELRMQRQVGTFPALQQRLCV
jgi:hypothetical protein